VGWSSQICKPQPSLSPQREWRSQSAISGIPLQQLQVSRQCQLLTSSDSCVRRIAEKGLQCEELAQWKKFHLAIIVRDTMQQDTSLSRKALRVAAKRSVTKEDDHARLSQLQSLLRQGHMVQSSPPDMPAIWAEAVQGLPDEQFKFALNAAHDTLPHNANLHLWKKKDRDTCTLCGDDQGFI